MTDAIVTDIRPYIARKQQATGEMVKAFAGYSDERVESRYDLLKKLQDAGDRFNPNHPALKGLFPKNFNPASHPEDNIDTVWAEGVRRGVFKP